ncbi:type II toxin-antitoxin system RelE/ParE family toxin [Kiloniella sp.]|uniref:type II toxin-antitoxin system RelE/ParE family toxin n=1 Tax=Kiloniella sp. TaxID=1938587 RepID=UPI003B01A09F
MIKSFRNKETEQVFNNKKPRKLPGDILTRAHAKLLFMNAAKDINDLRSPPSNHLEALKNDRKGQHSIRINKQWRICFVWKDGHAHDVEIIDYH